MVAHTKAYTIFSPRLIFLNIFRSFIPHKFNTFASIDKTISTNINIHPFLFSEKEYLCATKNYMICLKDYYSIWTVCW